MPASHWFLLVSNATAPVAIKSAFDSSEIVTTVFPALSSCTTRNFVCPTGEACGTKTRIDGKEIRLADFTDKRWGVSLGGPVFKDRLFLFGAYEKRKSADSQEVGPGGLGYSTEIPRITEANFNAISDVLRDTYGIDTGPLARSLPFLNVVDVSDRGALFENNQQTREVTLTR